MSDCCHCLHAGIEPSFETFRVWFMGLLEVHMEDLTILRGNPDDVEPWPGLDEHLMVAKHLMRDMLREEEEGSAIGRLDLPLERSKLKYVDTIDLVSVVTRMWSEQSIVVLGGFDSPMLDKSKNDAYLEVGVLSVGLPFCPFVIFCAFVCCLDWLIIVLHALRVCMPWCSVSPLLLLPFVSCHPCLCSMRLQASAFGPGSDGVHFSPLALKDSMVLVGGWGHTRVGLVHGDLHVVMRDATSEMRSAGRLGMVVSRAMAGLLSSGEAGIRKAIAPHLEVAPVGGLSFSRVAGSPPTPGAASANPFARAVPTSSAYAACGAAPASGRSAGAPLVPPAFGAASMALAPACGSLPLSLGTARGDGAATLAPARGALSQAPATACGIGASAAARGALPLAPASARGVGALAPARGALPLAPALARGALLPAADERVARKRPAAGHGGDGVRSDRSFSSPSSPPSPPRFSFSNGQVDAAVLSSYGACCLVFMTCVLAVRTSM